MPWWIRVVPFFLSAFFFLSAVFAIFAPMPLLLVRYRSGRRWAWLAAATNAGIVGYAGGKASLVFYLVFVVSLALSLSEFLKSRRPLARSAVLTLAAMGACAGIAVGFYSSVHHVNPVSELRQEISSMVDFMSKSVSSERSPVSVEDAEEWKQSVLVEFPSVIAVFSLFLVWVNLVTLLRVNPGGIRERLGLDAGFLKRWKAPEWLVWPTILTGVFLLWDAGRASDVALNVFRFLMAVYALQGLSILSYFFDAWNIRGIFRTAGYLAAVFLMMPLLLSLGFFDLWFDFRAKIRQS